MSKNSFTSASILLWTRKCRDSLQEITAVVRSSSLLLVVVIANSLKCIATVAAPSAPLIAAIAPSLRRTVWPRFSHGVFFDDERSAGNNKTCYDGTVAIRRGDGTGNAAVASAAFAAADVVAHGVGSDNSDGGGGVDSDSGNGKITCIDCFYDISTRFDNRSNRRSTSSSCSSGRRRMLLHIVIRLI